MADVSVLLNLTAVLSLEDADPFMSLVVDKGLVTDQGTLLFYDQLSVRRFPTEQSRYLAHLERLLSDFRNLLESRSFSTLDRGEDIRLIVALDLAHGLFEPEDGNKRCFPAQKVRLFKQSIERVFGKDNPLLPRLRYNFIFLENTLPSSGKLAAFYRSAVFDGFTGDTKDWINESSMTVGPKPVFKEAPDEDAPIENIPEALSYLDSVRGVAGTVRGFLDWADAGDAFREHLDKELGDIRCWKDFIQTDFNKLLRSSVSHVIGLSGEDFKNHDAFFLMKFAGSPAVTKRRDEIYVLSLVLLLATISPSDYDELFDKHSGKVFVMGAMPAESHLDQEQLCKLHDCIRFCLDKLKETGDVRKKKDGTVSFKVYSSRSLTPTETDTHTPLNTKTEVEQKALFDSFVDKRKVPFFFGSRPGDWDWYISVEEAMDKLLQHERDNSRPLYDSPRRITDKEMSYTEKECSYSELENIATQLTETESESVPAADVNDYLQARKQRLTELENACTKMKEQMLKLGYLFNVAWVTFFLSLAITLCYSFHFFIRRTGAGPEWIPACVAVAVVLFLIGILTAQFQIKLKINDAIREIDRVFNQLNTEKKNYLNQIAERARKQNEADIRRRNLAEMQEKLNAFNRHNLQVDRWETYFAALHDKMKDTLDLLRIGPSKKKEAFKLDDSAFTVGDFPSIPSDLVQSFHKNKTTFSCFSGKDIDNVVCFVKNFEFTQWSNS